MITFLGLPERTAGAIRGKQIADRLTSSQFIHAQSFAAAANKICIFVRNHFPESAKYYKSRGHIVGYDICDMHVAEAHQKNDKNTSVTRCNHDVYDFFIVNNTSTYSELSKTTNKPIFVIPHHTVNFNKDRITIKDTVKKIGYVGLKDQLSRFDELSSYLKSKNIEFVNVHPQTRQDCEQIFQNLDVGIIFLDESSNFPPEVLEAIKKYKPNTKVSNFQSYGIPVISVNYDSFEEFGKNGFIRADNYEDLINSLELLITNKQKRQELSNVAYEIAKNLHVDVVANMYKCLCDSLKA